ncbi:MAG: outer membrane beta-barrel protein, partial [Bacteroidota bacterium]
MTRVSFSFFSFIFVILIFGSTSAYGQLQDVSDRRVQVYVGGSPTYPYSTSEFGDFYQTGYTFTGGVGITLTPEWELSFQGTYSHFTLDDTLLPGGEGTLSVYAGTMNLKHLFRTQGRWIPYFSAGFGIFRRKADDITFELRPAARRSRTDATLGGAHLGFGIAARIVDSMSLFLEPRYTATASFQDT